MFKINVYVTFNTIQKRESCVGAIMVLYVQYAKNVGLELCFYQHGHFHMKLSVETADATVTWFRISLTGVLSDFRRRHICKAALQA